MSGPTFERFQRSLPSLSGADRLRHFDALPDAEMEAMWKDLAARREAERIRDGLILRRPDGGL